MVEKKIVMNLAITRKMRIQRTHILFPVSLSGHMGQYIYIYNMLCCQCGTAVWCCVYHSYCDWSFPKVRSYLNVVYSDTAANILLPVTFISVE